MKHNGQNIITDKDITMTGEGFQGEELSGVLTNHGDRLEMLESNVKWIYKNGGVGSGGSGGGGGTSWKVVVSRGDTGQVLDSGSTINFSGPGNYTFKVQIYGGGQASFKITYNWVNSRGSQIRNSIITKDDSFLSEETLLLDMNGSFSLTILNQDTQEPITYNINYIVASYTFNIYYVYADDKTRFSPSNNTIFMSEVASRGLMVALDYSVAVTLTSSSYYFVDWEINTITSASLGEDYEIKGNTSEILYLPLCNDIYDFLSRNENARYKQFVLNINIILEGNTYPEKIEPLALKDNLIPSGIYLKISTSGGRLFDDSQLEEEIDPRTGEIIIINNYPEGDQFALGKAAFQLTPYFNGLVPGRIFYLKVYMDGHQIPKEQIGGIDQLKDQTEQTISIPLSSSGEHILGFSISYEDSTYFVEYYIFVKESTSAFDWYPKDRVDPLYSSYYRYTSGCVGIAGLSQDDSISMTVNSQQRTYQFTTESVQSYDELDQLLCLGVQFSTTNDLEMPIASFNIGNDYDQSVFIFQNRVVISNTSSIPDPKEVEGDSQEIFFPMIETLDDTESSNYHLISIYKRLEYQDGNNYWKGIYIYIDGILEAAFKNFTTVHRKYGKITLYPNNYFVNLIESTCFKHQASVQEFSYLSDHDVLGYYYTYKEIILSTPIEESESNLYSYFGQLTIGTTVSDDPKYNNKNYVYANDTIIRNIALNSDVPVLVVSYTDLAGGINESIKGWDQDNFKIWMEKSYTEDADIEVLPVTIEWSRGKEDLKTITKTGEPGAAQFKITPQGSSTLGYRCKNWELYAPDASENTKTCIYSPNYDQTDTSTFLPEKSFTLKADIVDSSHTNNNAIGSFVNDITTPFGRAQQVQHHSSYKEYIKNCLSGFPTLVFLHTSYKSDGSAPQPDRDNYYFLGIYNFNLGRNSYYNLGYKDTSKLSSLQMDNGFHIYEIDESDDTLLNGIEVAEIQGNNNYFDFSQYDKSILFPTNEGDVTYMFGDAVTISKPRWEQNLLNLVELTSKAGGYTFTQVGKTFSATVSDNYGYDDGYSAVDNEGISKNQVPNYKFQAVRKNEGGIQTYTFTEKGAGSEKDLKDLILGDPTGEVPYTALLDYTSLCEYYTVCMAFGLVDSVQKNLNLKTWNGNEGYPLWYLAFYDMDTCLGVSNSGSRISYFAFSDYWKSSLDENNRLSEAMIYRDFSPAASGGEEEEGSAYYDTPSSYIFAVAKYAYSVLPSEVREDILRHPSNLWGLWRNRTRNVDPQTANDKQKGCLSSSDYFLDTYYTNHLKNVSGSAFNYNYRYKYFVVNSGVRNQFDSTNYPKFYGRKIAYTKDWLNGRFHILDAYFNINSVNDVMNRIGSVEILAPKTDDAFKDTTNKDIYVLKDIFSSTSTGNQYANLNYDVVVKARPYSPLISAATNAIHRYIFPQISQECTINLYTSGNQYVLLGGSSLWTSLSTINPFITREAALTVSSDYFTNLSGNRGTCRSWGINTPAIRTISLTNNSNYSGDLNFVSSGTSSNFPNLQTIDISGTAINLTVSNSPLTSVTANNMSGGKVDISNVSTLTNFSVSGKINLVSVPAWKGGGITFPLPNTSLRCTKIIINNDREKYPNNTLTINGNEDLQELEFSGFTEVRIADCPKLNKITIIDSGVLRILDVIIPDSTDQTTFTVGSTAGVVDLTNQTALANIRMRYAMMHTLKLPNKEVNFYESGAFRGCRNLVNIDGAGTYYITSNYAFADCQNLTLYQSSGSWSNIKVNPTLTDLSYTFYIFNANTRGSISLQAANHFLETCCDGANLVSNVSYLFYNQNIEYTKSMFLQEYRNSMCSICFEKLPNCTNFTRALYNCPIDAYNRFMFSGVAPNKNITFQYVIGENISKNPEATAQRGWEVFNNTKKHVVYITTDFLYEIIGDLYNIYFFDYNSDRLHFCVLDPETGNKVNIVEVGAIFNPFGIVDGASTKYPVRLRTIATTEFFPGHELDFSNTFRESWSAARVSGLSLRYFLYYESYPNITADSLDSLLASLPLSNAELVLTDVTYNKRVDMRSFINWDEIDKCSNLFYNPNNYKSLGFEKEVSADDFLYIWNKILTKVRSLMKNNNYGIGYLFMNCNIIGWIPDEFYLTTNSELSNENITNSCHLFENCKFLETSQTPVEQAKFVSLTHNFLKPIPKLKTAFYDFTGMDWKNTIPFDFFQKRKENEATVYVQPEGTSLPEERKLAKRYYYTYEKEMTNVNYCFSNIRLERPVGFDPEAAYNCGSFVDHRTRVIGTDQEIQGISYDVYYDGNQESSRRYVLEIPTEESDCLNIKSDYSLTVHPEDQPNILLQNYSEVYSPEGQELWCLFVAPDVLYGFNETSVSSITALFRNNRDDEMVTFTGVIPEHFLKQVMTSNIENMFQNLNITPRLLGSTYETEGGQWVEHKHYYYIPRGFTRYTDLRNTFNFHLIIPGEHKNHYYIFLDDSLPQGLSSLKDSLPNTEKSSLVGQASGYYRSWAGDNKIRYHIMGTPVYVAREDETFSEQTSHVFEYTLNELSIFMMNELDEDNQKKGATFVGHGYTITRITVERVSESVETDIWEGSFFVDTDTPFEQLKAEFAALDAGDTVRAYCTVAEGQDYALGCMASDGHQILTGHKNGVPASVEPGFDISKFKSLKLDNLVYPGLATFLYGDLFAGSISLENVWNPYTYLENSNNYVMYVGISIYGGLSYACLLGLPPKNRHFFLSSAGSGGCNVHQHSVTNLGSVDQTTYPNVTFVTA